MLKKKNSINVKEFKGEECAPINPASVSTPVDKTDEVFPDADVCGSRRPKEPSILIPDRCDAKECVNMNTSDEKKNVSKKNPSRVIIGDPGKDAPSRRNSRHGAKLNMEECFLFENINTEHDSTSLHLRNCMCAGEGDMTSRRRVETSEKDFKPFGNINVRPCSTCPRNYSNEREKTDLRNCMLDGGGHRIGLQPIKTSAEGPNLFENLRIRCQSEGSQGRLDVNSLFVNEKHAHDHRKDLSDCRLPKTSMERSNLFEDLRVEGWDKRLSSRLSTRGSFHIENHAYDSGRNLSGHQPMKSNTEDLNIFKNVNVRTRRTSLRDILNEKEVTGSRDCVDVSRGDMSSRQRAKSSAEFKFFG